MDAGTRKRLGTALVALLLASLAVVASIVFLRPDADAAEPSAVRVESAEARPTKLTSDLPATAPDPVVAATVADARGATVDLYAEPDVPFAERPTMDNPTHEGLPVVFLVLEERAGWLRVQASMRPNEQVVWVKRSQVRVRTVPNRIEVRLAELQLVVVEGETGRVLLQEPVAIGSSRTPTPVGRFFVDGWVPLDGTGPYGSGQLSVAGFSDVLQSFGGGIGQIAIHGTNVPSSIGRSISNGCVRMDNDTLLRLVEIAPLGTPVDIIA